MLKRFRNTGILGLVIAAGMALAQPVAANAADWHDRGTGRDRAGYHDNIRTDRNWNRGREYREYRGVDRYRGGASFYYNYAPAPRYYAAPAYGYGAYGYSNYGYADQPYCPR